VQVEELTRADRNDVIDILTEAFYDYPFMRFMLQGLDEEEYGRQLRLLNGFFADARIMRNWPFYGVRVDSDLVAAMLVSDPVFAPRPPELDRVYEQLCATVGEGAIKRMDDFDAATNGFMPDNATHFVGMLGVRTAAQREGCGRVLLQHIEDVARERSESAGVTLTTETEANVTYYESLGFRVLGSAEIGSVTSWLMFNELE